MEVNYEVSNKYQLHYLIKNEIEYTYTLLLHFFELNAQ